MPRRRRILDPATAPAAPKAPTAALITRATAEEGGAVAITEAGLAQIEVDAANGLSQLHIARRLGIARQSFAALRQRDPRVDEAFAAGRAQNESELVSLLMQKARGAASERDQLLAIMFGLKTLHGYRDSGPLDGAQTVNVQVNNYERMTTGEMRRRIDELLRERGQLPAARAEAAAVDAEIVETDE